ncbi:MAG: sugar porter family MFS transporter [Cyclobacteriaceae bacterium]|nr:sugar porter family MFS transporter [Cyclobacteriaceae bacterium]
MKKQNYFTLFVTSVAALGGLLFGFDTAVISGTTSFIQPYFELSDIGLGWTVSSLLLGCIIGVVIAGRLGDDYGRKKTLIISALLFFVSAIGSALAHELLTFILFRILGGLGVGVASMLSPMYISEIAPAKHRGRLVTYYQLAIVIGILLAFTSNMLLVDTGANNWRWMLSIMALPAVLFFGLLLFAPESPRWLLQKAHKDQARLILTKIDGVEKADTEMDQISRALAEESDAGKYSELFSPKMRAVLFMGIFIAVFSQITGINSIMYYAPVIFQTMGEGVNNSIIQTTFIGGTNLLFTIIAIVFVDRIGRKKLLIAGVAMMIVALSGIAIIYLLEQFTGYLALLFILLYIAAFASSLGPISWVVISEIFPNRLRSKAMSLSIVALWMTNFLLILVFPVMLKKLGGAISFLFFDVMCVLLLLFAIYRLPETKGKSLEEIEKAIIYH